jgi:hypothetical protein
MPRMKRKLRLSPSMDVRQFTDGYWFATELKAFATALGIPSAHALRKDELEAAIRRCLRGGKAVTGVSRSLKREGVKDVDRGRLTPSTRIVLYTNDEATKDFLEREARKSSPDYRRRSGARYRLNRWREEQMTKGKRITYGDLVAEYVRLSRPDAPHARVEHARYINFLRDFMAGEASATRRDALRAWKVLKSLRIPSNYRAWKRWQRADPR